MEGRKEGRREGGNEGGAYPVEGLTLNLKLRRLRLRMRRQSRAEWKLGWPPLRGGGGPGGGDPGPWIMYINMSEAYSLDAVLCCMLYAVYGSTYLELVSSFQELISKRHISNLREPKTNLTQESINDQMITKKCTSKMNIHS